MTNTDIHIVETAGTVLLVPGSYAGQLFLHSDTWVERPKSMAAMIVSAAIEEGLRVA